MKMTRKEHVVIALSAVAIGFCIVDLALPIKPNPDRYLRELLDDAPVYSCSFWIENKYGVVYEVHATAVRTNEQAKTRAKK